MSVEDYLKQIQTQKEQLEPQNTLRVSDLLSDSMWPRVSRYMEDRHGMTEDKYSREEILEAFENQMRRFNSGQSVVTLGEVTYLNTGEGEDLDRRRGIASDAYEAWDSLGNVTSYGSAGEIFDATRDYARALIVDPVNVLSLGAGKLVASGSVRAGATALKEAARLGAERAGQIAVRSGLSKSAVETARREGARKAYARALRQASHREATEKAISKEIIGSGAFDALASVGIDAAQQKAEVLTGQQDAYNLARGAFSLTLGGVGAGLSYALNSFRLARTAGIESTSERLEVLDRKASQIGSSPSNVAKAIDPNKLSRALTDVRTAFETYVRQGRNILTTKGVEREAFESTVHREFILEIKKVFHEAGVPVRSLDKIQGERRSGWLIDVIENPDFPPQARKAIEELYEASIKQIPGQPSSLGEYLRVVTAKAQDAGRELNAMRMLTNAEKALGRKMSTIKEAVDATISPVESETVNLLKRTENFQHNFIRMLVMHPATTALNVMGWAQASTSQTLSDMLRGALYGGNAVLSTLMGDTARASKYSNLARQMVRMQGQKIRNLVDPYSTLEETMDYLHYRPETQAQLFRYMYGGIEDKKLLAELQLMPGEKIDRTRTEKFLHTLQVAYGVQAQDFVTKTQEFMYALDKQLSLRYGMGFNEFIRKENIDEILRGNGTGKFEDFARVEAVAVEDALRNVFSKKFGPITREDKGFLTTLAGWVEEARSVPIIGAMVPFGQFFNNTLAFMFDHTGVTAANRAWLGVTAKLRGESTEALRDPMEVFTKTAIGMSLLGYFTSKELQNLEEGLAWNEERGSDGSVRTREYDFPLSFGKMFGRLAAHAIRDGEVPPELYDTAVKTFGFDAVSRQLGEAGGFIYEGLRMLATENPGEAKDMALKALMSTVEMYSSGFTRFAEPVNLAIGFAEGEDFINPNRKIGNENLNNALRYTDRIFDHLIGLENLPWDTSGYQVERRYAHTDRAPGAPINKVFGFREVQPSSSVSQMFNDVGRPNWQTEIRISDPSAAQTFNDYIFPLLEMYSDQVLESERWDGMSLQQKRDTVSFILRKAREDVKEVLANSSDEDASKASLIVKINGRRSSGRVYRDILRQFDVREDDLGDLEIPQLELILWFLEEGQRNNTDTIESILEK